MPVYALIIGKKEDQKLRTLHADYLLHSFFYSQQHETKEFLSQIAATAMMHLSGGRSKIITDPSYACYAIANRTGLAASFMTDKTESSTNYLLLLATLLEDFQIINTSPKGFFSRDHPKAAQYPSLTRILYDYEYKPHTSLTRTQLSKIYHFDPIRVTINQPLQFLWNIDVGRFPESLAQLIERCELPNSVTTEHHSNSKNKDEFMRKSNPRIDRDKCTIL
jgi:hypothetical protein